MFDKFIRYDLLPDYSIITDPKECREMIDLFLFTLDPHTTKQFIEAIVTIDYIMHDRFNYDSAYIYRKIQEDYENYIVKLMEDEIDKKCDKNDKSRANN